MSRLAAKYRDTTDRCVRCPLDRPTVAPDGLGPTTDSRSVVLAYRCTAGHCWTRTFRRSDLTHPPAKASTGPRRHLANRPTTTTTTTNADHEDESNLRPGKAGRQPSPRTRWCPDLRAWQLR